MYAEVGFMDADPTPSAALLLRGRDPRGSDSEGVPIFPSLS